MSIHSKFSMLLVIEFSKVFKDDDRSAEEILAQYGRTLSLKMIGVLDSILQQGKDELHEQIVAWFGRNGPLGQQIMERIFSRYRVEIGQGYKLGLVNCYSNLRMNILAKKLAEIDENTLINIDQAHLDLFKAYLKLNEVFLENQEQIGKTMPDDYIGLKQLTWQSTATLLSYYDFINIDQILSVTQLIKAMYCLEFLQQYNAELYLLFLQSKGVRGIIEYATKIMPLTQLCFSEAITINGLNSENQNFLELYNNQSDIVEDEEDIVKYDFISIRNKPLFLVGENEYIILNRAMIINKVYSSIYWDCKAILPQLKISEDRFRTDFTTDFSEGFLVYKLFEKAYGNKSCKKFSGKEMKKIMGDSEPDYYIRNGNKVFLVEVKDSFISGKVKQSFSVPKIQDEISKKYYKDQKSEKAVKQLITRIKFSLTKSYPFDQNYKPKSLKFYPILIVYDINLTVPGIETLMIDWFNTEREALKLEMKGKGIEGFHINDLVILHIDGLVLLTDYIRAGKVKLEDLINNHIARKRDFLKIRKGMKFEDFEERVLKSFLSFNHFVMDYFHNIPQQDRLFPAELKFLEKIAKYGYFI